MKRTSFPAVLLTSVILLMAIFVCVGCDSTVATGPGDIETATTMVVGVLGGTSTTLGEPPTSLQSTTITNAATTTTAKATTTTAKATTTTAKATTTTKTTLGPPPVQTTITMPKFTLPTVDIGPIVTIDPWALFQETDSHMQWSGLWVPKSSAEATEGAYRAVGSTASVLIRFTGQRISFQAMEDKAAGIAKLTLDGTKVYMVDLYAEGFSSQMAWISDPLPPGGTHTVLIEWTGTKNPKNVYTTDFITIDYVAVYGGALLNP